MTDPSMNEVKQPSPPEITTPPLETAAPPDLDTTPPTERQRVWRYLKFLALALLALAARGDRISSQAVSDQFANPPNPITTTDGPENPGSNQSQPDDPDQLLLPWNSGGRPLPDEDLPSGSSGPDPERLPSPPPEPDFTQPFTLTTPQVEGLEAILVSPTDSTPIFQKLETGTSRLIPPGPDTDPNGNHFIIHAGVDDEGKPLAAEALRALIQGTWAEKTPAEQKAAIESLLGQQLNIDQDAINYSYTVSSITPIPNDPLPDTLAQLHGVPPGTKALDLLLHSPRDYAQILADLGIKLSPNALTLNFCGITISPDGNFSLDGLVYIVVAEPAVSSPTEWVPSRGHALAASYILPSPDVEGPARFGTAYTNQDMITNLGGYLDTNPRLGQYFLTTYSNRLNKLLSDIGVTVAPDDYLASLVIGTGPAHNQNLQVLRGESQGSHLFEWNGQHLAAVGIIIDPAGLHDADQARLIIEEIVQKEQINRSILPAAPYLLEVGYLTDNNTDLAYQLARGNLRAYMEFWQQAYLGNSATLSYQFTFNGESIKPADYRLVLGALNELADTNFTLNDMMFNPDAIETLHRELREKGIEDPISIFGIQRFPSLDIRSEKSSQLKPLITN